MKPPIIEEGPFTLRLPRAEDVSWVFHACQDEDIQRFTMVPTPYRPSDAVAWVASASETCATGTALDLLVMVTETSELLGAASLKLTAGDGRGEIGYWVERDARRRGVASAAVAALERHGADALGLSEVQLRIAEQNVASRALAEAAGYELVGAAAMSCNGLPAVIYVKSLAND
jgi:RimJ/RimL family protein N-acetyltransferase